MDHYHWMSEELARLISAERQREREAFLLQHDFCTSQLERTFTSRVALKLSHWLIAIGESLRWRHEKAAPATPWVDLQKFAR